MLLRAGGGLLARQGQPHPGAPFPAVGGHVPSLFTCELADDVQAEPDATELAPITAHPCLDEAVEDPLLVLAAQPHTIVLDDHGHGFTLGPGADVHGSTLWGELQRVVQELVHD